jgi:hypothetical protein
MQQMSINFHLSLSLPMTNGQVGQTFVSMLCHAACIIIIQSRIIPRCPVL